MKCGRVMATLLLMVCYMSATSMQFQDGTLMTKTCMASEPTEGAPELPVVEVPAVETSPADVPNVSDEEGFSLKSVMAFLWEKMNTPAGLELVAIFCAFVAGKIYLTKPKWKKYYDDYQGYLVAAIKFAEKTVPKGDNATTAERRATAALNYALGVIQAGKKNPSVLDKDALGQALNVVHDEADSNSTL